MPDYRVYHSLVGATTPSQLTLDAAESHHLVNVNRARVGDPVIAFDGHGREWLTTLAGAAKRAAILHVVSCRSAPPRGAAITLAQALPKGPAMDAIVRKATEIGVARLVPLTTARTQVHLDDDRSDRKHEKWATAALEAAKQCGNPWLPTLDPVTAASAFFTTPGDQDLKLIASLHPGARPLHAILAARRAASPGQPLRRAAWAVGPEGDFTPEEMAHALAAGFHPVSLGPLVLRCETAAIYALSILSYELAAS